MAKRVVIRNFCGIKEGSVESLKPLSVLVGRNNSGKSTILEALYLGSQRDGHAVIRLISRRGWCGIGCISQLAYEPLKDGPCLQIDDETIILVLSEAGLVKVYHKRIEGSPKRLPPYHEAEFNAAGEAVVRQTRHAELALVPCTLIDPDVVTEEGLLEDAYSAALDRGHEEALDVFIKAIDDTAPALRILKKSDRYVLHAVTKERAVSVYFGGDGYKRLLFIAFNLAAHAGELVLLEEPECFQHPSYLGRLAALIWAAIGQGTQVVISTHSLELLKHLFLAENVPLDQAAIFHTSLTNGKLRAVRIPGPSAAERLEELGEDLRQ